MCQTLDRATFKRLLMPLEDKFEYHSEYLEQRPARVGILEQVVSDQPEVVARKDAMFQKLQDTDAAAEAYVARLVATRVMREQVGARARAAAQGVIGRIFMRPRIAGGHNGEGCELRGAPTSCVCEHRPRKHDAG